MKSEKRRYSLLKLRYLEFIHRKHETRGNIRAFIALSTWLNERERIGAGEKQPVAHLTAFEQSLDHYQKTVDISSFSSSFESLREEWLRKGGEIPREPLGKPFTPSPTSNGKQTKRNGYSVISLFSGALGLDLGFHASGFEIRFTTDIEASSKETVKMNLPGTPFVHEDFTKVKTDRILREAGLDVGEADVLTGGPPCQPFSTAGKRKGFADPRASPLKEFVRAIKEIQPKVFVMEEVTGILSSRIKHVPIAEQKSKNLSPDEEKGSVFRAIVEMLNTTDYHIKYNVLNAADYGAPQQRSRLIFVGVKQGVPRLPEPSFSGNSLETSESKTLEPWTSLWESTSDLKRGDDEYVNIPSKRAEYLRIVPPGGYWKHLPPSKQKEALGGAYHSGGGRMGFFRRLSWEEPSPTLVTSPVQKSSMLCHPEALRPLSIQEYKRIQGFPDDWKLPKGITNRYRLIGNAVSVHLSHALANTITEILEEPLGVVEK